MSDTWFVFGATFVSNLVFYVWGWRNGKDAVIPVAPVLDPYDVGDIEIEGADEFVSDWVAPRDLAAQLRIAEALVVADALGQTDIATILRGQQ